jgi:3-oxoacyl-(acyl-carrier-protein) synthase
MKNIYIQRAAAISPLGTSLDDIWEKVLVGATAFGSVKLSAEQHFFAAESVRSSSSDITVYAPLFNDTVRALVAELNIDEPVDAIFFATAVGNLAHIENEIYCKRIVDAEALDFSATEKVFAETRAWGPNTRFICVPTGCCAGVQAAGLARQIMHALNLRRAIVMSIDFGLTPLGYMAFDRINATIAFDESITSSPSRPFCNERSGFLFADGGGAILVSTEPTQQGQPRISGYGCVSSAFHMTDIASDGGSIKASIEKAINEAGLAPEKISHVNLHASGTQQNDAAEFQALSDIFGPKLPTITAFKGNHGHALGGANMIEIALSWKMLTEQKLPCTPDGLGVDAYENVGPRSASRPSKINAILKTASGFGGIHASLLMEN